MSSQNDAEHNPMEDVFMHVICDRWAEKLAVTRVEHFSKDEHNAFEQHVQSCLHCREQMLQYRVVDKYLYRHLLAEQFPVVAKAPPLLRRGRFSPLWVSLQHLVVLPRIDLQRAGALFLQGSGLILLLLILGDAFFQAELEQGMTPVALLLLALAFCLILLGSREQPNKIGKAGQQHWSRIEGKQNALAWREFSLPLPAVSGMQPERVRRRHQSRLRLHPWRNKWIWGVAACLFLAICLVSLHVLSPFSSSVLLDGPEPSGAPLGISVDGSRVFDTSRQDGDLKRQAASKMLAGDSNGAKELWKQALVIDSNDAEVLIYRENVTVADSHHPYFTLVVGTIFSQQHIGGARDILQGAYVAQKEYNEQAKKSHGLLLRLMVAAADVDAMSPMTTAKQIVQAAQKDPTILGVIGWSTSRSALSALQELALAHIPMVSPTASSDYLSGKSAYFFRVAPTDTQQATLAAQYAKQILSVKRVVLLTDPNDTYSASLAQAFMQHYPDKTHTIIHAPFFYTKGVPSTVENQVNDILGQKPDLIYFAGYVNEASVLLKYLPACQTQGSCLLVMGGDALDVQGDYSLEAFKNYGRLRFTAFASQEQSQALHPQFFAAYTQAFDPLGQYRAGTYGYNATDADIILGYDAASVFIAAREQLQAQGMQHVTAPEMQKVLQHIQVNGVSGVIHFDPNGNPIGKKIVILKGNESGHTVIDLALSK